MGTMNSVLCPIGLTNTPTSFQAFMNHIFEVYLVAFVLIFSDDILVYNPSME